MLVLKPCFHPDCNGFSYTDKTGTYNATTNPEGYGSENGVTGPDDFDTYSLSVWLPGQDPNSPAQAVLDLLPAPEPNAQGFYTWEFTLSDLGVSEIPYGFARMEITGVKDGDTFTATSGPLFLGDIPDKVNKAMLKFDPSCPCKKGCQNPIELFSALQAVKCGGVCDAEATERILKYIDNNIKNCC